MGFFGHLSARQPVVRFQTRSRPKPASKTHTDTRCSVIGAESATGSWTLVLPSLLNLTRCLHHLDWVKTGKWECRHELDQGWLQCVNQTRGGEQLPVGRGALLWFYFSFYGGGASLLFCILQSPPPLSSSCSVSLLWLFPSEFSLQLFFLFWTSTLVSFPCPGQVFPKLGSCWHPEWMWIHF